MQAEALFDSGSETGIVSADRATDLLCNWPDRCFRFRCPACLVEYTPVAIRPRPEPYRVSPHFRLGENSFHKDGCPYGVTNDNALEIHSKSKRTLRLEILQSVPQILLLPVLKAEKSEPETVPAIAGSSRVASALTDPTSPSLQGKVRSSSIRGIVQFRNSTLKESPTLEAGLSQLALVPLQLPGPPPRRMTYKDAFRKFTSPHPGHRIYFGVVQMESDNEPRVLVTQERISPRRSLSYTPGVGQPAKIILPDLADCTNPIDRRFLLSKSSGRPFRIYCYCLPVLEQGALSFRVAHWDLVEFRPLFHDHQATPGPDPLP